jgi:hypothetical protein
MFLLNYIASGVAVRCKVFFNPSDKHPLRMEWFNLLQPFNFKPLTPEHIFWFGVTPALSVDIFCFELKTVEVSKFS